MPNCTIRVGFVASKRVGKAVQRNRAKRLLRALFIIYADSLKGGYYIFVAKPSILEADFQRVHSVFEQTLKRAQVL